MDFAHADLKWELLTNDQQLGVADVALRFAMRTVAGHADTLAGEMENGCLLDRGGPDALRLLASALRVSMDEPVCPAIPMLANLATLGVAGHA